MELMLYLYFRPVREWYLNWVYEVSGYTPSRPDERKLHEWEKHLERRDPSGDKITVCRIRESQFGSWLRSTADNCLKRVFSLQKG
jgi:hypothetical protein